MIVCVVRDLVDRKGSVGTGNRLAIYISAQGTEFTYVSSMGKVCWSAFIVLLLQ